MAIKITGGPAGAGSPLIIFEGSASDGTTSANIVNSVVRVEARVNSLDSDYLEILDLFATTANGFDTLDVQPLHYSEWEDRDGNTFANTGDVKGYIDGFKPAYLASRRASKATPTILPISVSVSSGSSFSATVNNLTYGAIFWDESTFVSGVEVSRFDRRKISGTISSTGTYNFGYTVANLNGNSVGIVTVTVV